MMDRSERIQTYIGTVAEVIRKLPVDRIEDIVQTLKQAYEKGSQVLLCGNGGSASTASHFAEDLQKGIGALSEKKFRVMALVDSVPLITAWANDTDYSRVFAEQVETWGRPGDVLIGISGSGNSPNVLRAVEKAKALGLTTIGLGGMGGGKLAGLVDKLIVVESDSMQQIEDVHIVLAHLIYSCLYQEISQCG